MTGIRGSRPDGGSVVLWVLVVVAMAATMGVLVVRVAVGATARARCQAVADLVALAAVDGSRAAAEGVARANGGHIEDMRTAGAVVTVTVSVAGERARAHAAPEGVTPIGTGST